MLYLIFCLGGGGVADWIENEEVQSVTETIFYNSAFNICPFLTATFFYQIMFGGS